MLFPAILIDIDDLFFNSLGLWNSGIQEFRFPGGVDSAFPKSGHSHLDGANVAKHLKEDINIAVALDHSATLYFIGPPDKYDRIVFRRRHAQHLGTKDTG